MSVKVMGRVWDSTLPPNLRLVLLAYSDAAEHDGTRSFPGWQRLVHMTGYSRSQVSAITTELLALGVLIQVKSGHRGQRAEFAVDLEALQEVSEPETQSDTESVQAAGHNQHQEVSEPETQSDTESVASDPPKVSPLHDTSRPRPVQGDLLPTVVDHATAPKQRRPDPIWDTLVDVFGDVTNEASRGPRNTAVKHLKTSGAVPDEIRLRVAAWPFHFPDATITATALAKHWDTLGRPPARAAPADVARLENEQRRALRRAHAQELDAQARGLPA